MAKKQNIKKKKKSLKFSPSVLVFIACMLSLAMMLYTLALFLCIGMMPTIVAYFTNKRQLKIKALTIGAMNFAGCFPYVLELIHYNNDMEKSLDILSDPMTIVTAYSAAAIGYVLDWAVTGIASNLLYQKGLQRKQAIIKEQENFIERWGQKVTGDIDLDKDGFPYAETE